MARSRLCGHEHRAAVCVLVRAHPPDRQAGPDRAHAPRRHGHRPVRLARRPEGPGGHRVPGGGERLHRGARPRGSASCGPRCSTRSRRAPRRPTCRCRCARGTGGGTRAPWRGSSTRSTAAAWCATARSPRRCRRTASRLTARRCCSTGTSCAEGKAFFSLGALSVVPGREAARLLHRLRRRRAVHAAGQGPGHRRDAAPTRCPTPTTAAPGRLTGPRCSTSRSTRRGGLTGSGGTSSGRRRRTTWWCSRRATRSSGSASARHATISGW